MPKKCAFLYICYLLPILGFSQELHKHFEAKPTGKTEKINLQLTTKAGASFINAISTLSPVLIYGGNSNDIASSTFQINEVGQTQHIKANLTCKEHAGHSFTEAIASNLFSDKSNDDFWQVNLSNAIAFDLDLKYLVGSSMIDLSDLAVERLKINSGSADVFIKYANQKANAVAMDTFFIKVNMGNIEVSDLDLASAKEIIAEVDFGNINLDCGTRWKINSKITASVGAGSMVITLPQEETPILVKLNDSPLCHVKMGKEFKKVGHNAYGNKAYQKDQTNNIEFSLDVGMGSISFVTK